MCDLFQYALCEMLFPQRMRNRNPSGYQPGAAYARPYEPWKRPDLVVSAADLQKMFGPIDEVLQTDMGIAKDTPCWYCFAFVGIPACVSVRRPTES